MLSGYKIFYKAKHQKDEQMLFLQRVYIIEAEVSI